MTPHAAASPPPPPVDPRGARAPRDGDGSAGACSGGAGSGGDDRRLRSFRWSLGAYRHLLRAYPRPFRDRFADAMVDDFAALCEAETRAAGQTRGRARAWRCALADLCVSAARERQVAHARSARIARARRDTIAPVSGPESHGARRKERITMIGQEIRFAGRRLRRTPGFTLAAVLTLGLGIGGTTAVFSVLQAVVLRPLPFPEPHRLVRLREVTPQGGDFSTSEPNFLDFRARLRTIEDLAAFTGGRTTLLGRGDAEDLRLTRTSRTLFTIIGASPILGRTFTEQEDRRGGGRVIVLTYGLWQRRFGGNPQIVGQRLLLDGNPTEVIGVLPRGADFPANTDAFVPLAASLEATRGDHRLRAVGRMRAGATLADVRAEAAGVARQLSAAYPDSNGGWGVRLDTFDDFLIGSQLRQTLFVLMGAAALLLAIACVNVGNLIMVRATSRRRELAMQAALGAGRWRIIRGLLVESLLLAIAGGVLGVLLAFFGVPVLRTLAPDTVPRLNEATVDVTVLLVAIAISACVGVAFGILPALLQTRAKPQDWLRDSTGGACSSGRRRMRELLVAGELALAMMLLVGAALLVDSFRRLQTVDVGFDATHVYAATVVVSGERYRFCDGTIPNCDGAASARRRVQYFDDAQRALAALPGAVAVGGSSIQPLGGGATAQELTVEGHVPRGKDDTQFIDYRIVTPGFFPAMSLPILRGRNFTADDTTNAMKQQPVVIVSEALVKRYWPNDDPIGKRVAFGKNSTRWMPIVGVAHDLRDVQRQLDPQPIVYLPLAGGAGLTLVLKTQGDVAGTTDAMRRALQSIDTTIPIASPFPLMRNLDRTMTVPRFSMLLMALFAGVALALAAIGVYGVTAYAVALRTREIGVRLALGAEPGQMVRLIAGRGLMLAVAGIAVGSLGAFLLSGFVATLLYQTRPVDVRSHALVAIVLVAVACVAIVIPALRASRIDPRQALLGE